MLNLEQGDGFINGWVIEDLSLCDQIISFFNKSLNKHDGTVHRNNMLFVDKSEKLSVDCSLLDDMDLANKYAEQLQKVCDKYIEKYPYCNEGKEWGIAENINVQGYPKGGGYFKYHFERNCGEGVVGSRHLVFMTYLNDVEDGGETEFLYQKIKIKPKKGLTVIFPADWTFTHRGIASPTEEKFIVTGWYNYL
jgi:prolyl 4-hydroxylase